MAPGLKISGILAWFLWRTIYLAKIPGIKSKVRIGTDWLIHLLFPPDLAQTGQVRLAYQETAFRTGRHYFHQGDLGDSVYVIERGECEMRELNGSGTRLATLQAGDYFGEMALLSEPEPQRHHSGAHRNAMALDSQSQFNELCEKACRLSAKSFTISENEEAVKGTHIRAGMFLKTSAKNVVSGPFA